MTKLTASKTSPPLGALLAARAVEGTVKVEVKWGEENSLSMQGDVVANTSAGIARCLARTAKSMYGSTVLQQTEVDHWLTFSLGPLSCPAQLGEATTYLDTVLQPATWLVGDSISIADYEVFGSLASCPAWLWQVKQVEAPASLTRWYTALAARPEVAAVLDSLPPGSRAVPANPATRAKQAKEESAGGKFVELPGAKEGEVVVRFPPEASGFLHVGHAKAALLNYHYKESFKGKLVMRFDDTNPAKEKEEYEGVILEDLKLLQVKYDHFSRTSDHFETILGYCEKLIKEGKAYCDDTDAETMKAERDAMTKSKNWNNSVERNLELWAEMKAGSEVGTKCAVRAKINMESLNGCLRDPTIYRCKPEPHPATGTKYKVYPTYDFACPIVDSVEGVTHALRTTEYMDRDDQFNWFIDALGLRKPHIWAYARLNLTNTVMSKRKLTWLVETGVVEGWEDPRLPTVRGILRRGLTVEALKQFIIAQGSSRSVVFMEWDKIWAFNKKVLDPIVARHTTVDQTSHVPVLVAGAKLSSHPSARHPKNPEVGEKQVWTGPRILIDTADAEQLKVGENATFINWGNLMIKSVNKEGDKVVSVDAEDNTENKDFKKTLKVTWLCDDDEKSPKTPVLLVYYDHIISKPILDKDDDFKNFVNSDSRHVVEMLGDPELRSLRKGDMVQVQRRGYFICDVEYKPYNPCVGRARPAVLIAIPDGTANSYGPPGKQAAKPAVQEKAGGKKGEKKQEVKKQPVATKPDVPSAPAGADLNTSITAQGDLVRKLKADKADKATVTEAVNKLLSLKAEFKTATGSDWKPGAAPAPAVTPAPISAPVSGDLNTAITAQGDAVRKLKAEKADKTTVTEAVNKLLSLKAEFKAATGSDWKPGAAPAPTPAPTAAGADLNGAITAQGDIVRKLKADKADKATVTEAVNKLLALKAEYKTATGQDWKPGAAPSTVTKQPSPPKEQTAGGAGGEISAAISAQGDRVRQLKADKKSKEEIDTAVKELLKLKADFKAATGADWKPAGDGGKAKPEKQKKEKKEAKPKDKPKAPEAGVTRLGMEVKKEENLADWYSQVLTKAEMLEYYDVSGCYILRPWSYSIWEVIKDFFDAEIKKLGVTNAYFPIFVSHAALEREKDHIADFAPEVAWVTKSGESDLAEPIAIRPTSETVMYPAYAKWIQSYRDLPIKLNQWNNVVRWEFKHPQPFLRTREFLWQEGHTAFATFPEAKEEVMTILDLYRRIYEELLAVPVIRGRKTEKEKFAGGDYTTTTEAYISAAGRAIQGATSHHLGQNFSKMFDITFESPETGEKEFVWQNSWGITTRTIGVLVMVHGDNNGLVLPPRVAQIQVVIVPCGISANLKEEDKAALYKECEVYEQELRAAGVRVRADLRENYSPGWKYNHWELKGVPIRLDVGPKDMKASQYVAVRRDTGAKVTMRRAGLSDDIPALLETIQSAMFAKARTEMTDHVKVVTKFEDFLAGLDEKCLLQAPFCGAEDCEDTIKDLSKKDADLEPGAPSMGAKSLCIPFSQPAQILDSDKCIKPGCCVKPKFYTLFGRSY